MVALFSFIVFSIPVLVILTFLINLGDEKHVIAKVLSILCTLLFLLVMSEIPKALIQANKDAAAGRTVYLSFSEILNGSIPWVTAYLFALSPRIIRFFKRRTK